MSLPDAENLIQDLCRQIKPQLMPASALIGIHTGGAWLAERLQQLLGGEIPLGTLDISFYRDDFSRIGLHPQVKPSHIPFEVEDRHIILVDDVLNTGRTIRAAMNELFDYGRPASVRLAVLVDRGARELPVQADFAAARVSLPADQSLALARADDGAFTFEIKG